MAHARSHAVPGAVLPMLLQVGLEFAALYPQRVEKLVLLNGTHGKVFQTAFQPWLRIPPVNEFLYFFIDTL